MKQIAHKEETQGTETSKYLKEEKENSIPLVAASEAGRAQTGRPGFRTLRIDGVLVEWYGKASHRRLEPCRRKDEEEEWIQSRTEHVEFRLKIGGPPPKAKYSPTTDREQVP